MNNQSLDSPIYDYFLVCGLSQNDRPFRDVNSDDENTRKLFFKPSLLWRFPNDRKDNPWNEDTLDGFLQLCHPNNVQVTDKLLVRKTSFHSFLSIKSDGFRFYGHVLTYFEKNNLKSTKGTLKKLLLTSFSVNEDDCLYMQKCICLVSQLPYINTSERILRTLHKRFTTEENSIEPGLCVDNFIYNILFEVVVPSPGKSLALKWDRCNAIVIQRPGNTELPLLDVNLTIVFELLGGPRNVLKLLISAFLEYQILLVSEDCHKMFLVAEAITSLMFPFKWVHPYAPVLPFTANSSFLEAPMPYIMGLPLRSSDKRPTRIESRFKKCFVDIDNEIIQCPEDQPPFPNQISVLQQLEEVNKTFQCDQMEDEIENFTNAWIVEQGNEENYLQNHWRDAEYSKSKRYYGKTEKEDDLVAEELRNLHATSSPQPGIASKHCLRSNQEHIFQDLFNDKVREIIFGTLVSVFSRYDKFVRVSEESNSLGWNADERSFQNFDEAPFLSDQPAGHLLFLTPFLKTQAFASLVDDCILSHQLDKDNSYAQSLFDMRIKEENRSSNSEKTAYQHTKCIPSVAEHETDGLTSSIPVECRAKKSTDERINSSEVLIKRRHLHVNGRYPVLKRKSEMKNFFESNENPNIRFPTVINPSLLSQNDNTHSSSPTRKELSEAMILPTVSEIPLEPAPPTDLELPEKLLRDIKTKTNELVVFKLSQDVYKQGHSHISLLGLDENLLIGSLCDLLEKIWCHGLNSSNRNGKSALWSHLCSYQEDSVRIVFDSDPRTIIGLGDSLITSNSEAIKGDVEGKSDKVSFPPVNVDLLSSIRRIRNLSEVKTTNGKCRAWIRLALEQKQLQAHLKKLLLNQPLLQITYRRNSFLRCEDEAEQFLYHLLALNTIDFSCFSNIFTKTVISYRVWILPKKQINGISQTTANVYIKISGVMGCTDMILVPKNCNEFVFSHRNLGVLTTVLFGHDNSGLLSKWHVNHIVIRNELTGQAFYFPCDQWLGRGTNDGSSQKMLVAYNIPLSKKVENFLCEINVGTVSIDETVLPKNMTVDQLKDIIRQRVSDIVHHLTVNANSPSCAGVLTTLLLTKRGLISLMAMLFQHRLKMSRMPRKRYFAWDVLKSVLGSLSTQESSYKSNSINVGTSTNNSSTTSQPGTNWSGEDARWRAEVDTGVTKHRNITYDEYLVHVFKTLNSRSGHGLGKDDMFQLFIYAGLKKHALSEWLQRISLSLQQSTLYERNAFILNKEAIDSVCNVLKSIDDTCIKFERILWRGFDSLINCDDCVIVRQRRL